MRGIGVGEATAAGAILLASLVLPASAYADMGPLVLWLEFGVLTVLCVEAVVVVIETPVLRRFLGVSYSRAFLAALAGNTVSALFGIPAAFVLGTTLVSAFASFEMPEFVAGVAPAFLIVLASFVFSSLIEWPVVKLIAHRDWRATGVAVLAANALSHAALLAIAVAVLIRQGGV